MSRQVTIAPAVGVLYLDSPAQRDAPRFVGIPCGDAFAGHVGDAITVYLELKSVNPTTLRVYPYQSSGVSLGPGSHYQATVSSWRAMMFTSVITDYGITYPGNTGTIGVYDDSNAGGGISVRNVQVYAGAEADITCLVDSLTIQHGRQGASGQPDASSCTLNLSTAADGSFTIPFSLEIGAQLYAYADDVPRFAGNITDILYSWEDAGADTPDRPVAQITATGVLDQLARIPVGGGQWDQQLDGARVSELVAEAGFGGLDPQTSDPGTVQIVSQTLTEQVLALDACRDVADSAGGVMWESRDGGFRYADADHRSGATYALTLDACDLLVTPTWRRTLAGMVNRAVVGYGDPTVAQLQASSVNAASQDRYGDYGTSVTTLLARLADAQAMADLLTTRGADPVWIMAALPVDTAGLDPDTYTALLYLDMHSLIALTGLPAVGNAPAAPTSAALWVEGWTETLTATTHELNLFVSGYCRTVAAPRWDDLDPTWTWDNVDPALTWDSATCFGPPVQQGRWLDVSSTLRWDQVPASVTWDSWNAFVGAP